MPSLKMQNSLFTNVSYWIWKADFIFVNTLIINLSAMVKLSHCNVLSGKRLKAKEPRTLQKL